MIQVERNAQKPEGFETRAALWQAELEQLCMDGFTPSQAWNRIRPKIKNDADHLKRIFHEKCAFCESEMRHVSYPSIEHYRPKAKFKALIFMWENWLLSCGVCNDNKWAHFPMYENSPCLIDPGSEDPGKYISFINAEIFDLQKRGRETIDLVELARDTLVKQREIWLGKIDAMLVIALKVPDLRSIATMFLHWFLGDEAPYSSMARIYLKKRGYQPACKPELRRHIQLQDPLSALHQFLEQQNISTLD